ncbi:MAG: Vms1/Ankzf1 family peptidyl-tRNA hydrolase [Thermoplasmata archaeon]
MSQPDLRRLADIWDTCPSFLSIYLDLSEALDINFIQRRRRDCERALAGDREALLLFREAMATAMGVLEQVGKEGAPRTREGLAIFCSPRKNFLEVYDALREVGNLLVFDSSPYIKPLVMLSHEWEEWCVVALDHTHARIFMVSHHRVIDRDEVVKDIIRKHRKGGMSQLRFQRLHDGYETHYFKEVAEHLVKEVEKWRAVGRFRGIILEGPSGARRELERHLPQELARLVLGRTETGGDVPEAEALRAAEAVVRKRARLQEAELIQHLRTGILKQGLVAYGFEEVEAATALGRADTIAIQRNLALRGWRCESCRAFGSGDRSTCPSCGSPPLSVDAIEELVELAMDRRTRVEFVSPESGISEFGGVGALLRY